jgi:hypothetical protein
MIPTSETDSRKPFLTRELLGVGLFVGSYMAAAVVRAAYARNVEFLFYIAVMLLLILAVVLIHRRVTLSQGLLWALAAWGGMHMAGGLVPLPESWSIDGDMRVLYNWWIVPKQAGSAAGGWLKYDQLTHAYGFGVTTWLCWQGLRGALTGYRRAGRNVEPTIGLMVITGAAGAGFGALNEIVEFIATRITITNVGGYENTGWDLVYNAVGAAIAVGLIYAFRRRGI